MARKRRLVTAQLGSIPHGAELDVVPGRSHSDVHPKQILDEDAPRVLIVDTNHGRRDALVDMLQRIYHTEVADDAMSAIAMCARHKPHVVIRGATDGDDQRLEQLLVLALGKTRPPVMTLADIMAEAKGAEPVPGGDRRLPDSFTLVSAIERTVAVTTGL